MPYILLSIIAVAALVVAGMSAVHGPAIITTGPAAIAPAFTDWGSLWPWLLAVAVIGLCGWWLFRRRRT